MNEKGATATFPAAYVKKRCEDRIVELTTKRAEARDAWIDKYMAKPYVAGWLWWREVKYRTRAEAYACYRKVVHYSTAEWRVEHPFDRDIKALKRIHLLASAAASVYGSSGISLNAGDCFLLDCPPNYKEPE